MTRQNTLLLVANYITNSKDFSSTDGWYPINRASGLTIEKVCGRFFGNFKPIEEEVFNAGSASINRDFYIRVTAPDNTSGTLYGFYNTGFADNRLSIEINANDRIALRGYVYNDYGSRIPITDNSLSWSLAEGTLNASGVMQPNSYSLIDFTIEKDELNGIVYFIVNKNNYTKETFKKNSSVQLFCDITAGTTFYFKELQLFRAVYDEQTGQLIEPNSTNNLGKAEIRKTYFTLDAPNSLETKENNLAVTTVTGNCQPVYYSKPEKIRSIEVKESNYFNILQNIAETFGVWLRIEATHDSTGKILTKNIWFKNYIGKENHAGFRYGVNLKENSRTEVSKNIVTKLIVKDNKNEFAPNGFCSIARAPLNEAGENTLYNFSYYYKSGLIDEKDVIDYLYNGTNPQGKDIDPSATQWNAQNYFKRLKNINAQLDQNTDQMLCLSKEIVSYSANIELKTVEVSSATEEAANIAISFQKRFQTPINEEVSTEVANSADAKAMYATWIELQNRAVLGSEELNTLTTALNNKNTAYQALQQANEQLIEYKNQLYIEFYKKFGRFINEGTWGSEEYIDDNQYYIDSLSTLHNSCYPTAEYSLKVSSVDALPGYETFTFEIGDQTYVEDEEYFGTTDRIDVVVTETVNYLDDPTKDSIKIQNFTDPFQDLFQKITATVQQAQYKSGAYDKAAQFVESPDEHLSFIEEAFEDENAAILIGGQATVMQNKSGLCIRDVQDPFNELRLLGGKILISRRDENGKQVWSLGLSSQGLSADLVTAGILNAGKIMIMDNNEPAFRWDQHGISAFKPNGGGYNTHTFVRFDKHGLYGISNEEIDGTVWYPKNEQKIKEKSIFQLTWEGLKVTGNNEVIATLGKNARNIFEVVNGENPIFTITNDGEISAVGLKITNGAFTISSATPGNSSRIVFDPDGTLTGTPTIFQIYDSNGQLTIGLNDEGNAFFSGNITATTGSIGGFSINGNIGGNNGESYPVNGLWYGNRGQSEGFYIIPSGIGSNCTTTIAGREADDWVLMLGENFGITKNGALYASSGGIGGWNIATFGLSYGGDFGSSDHIGLYPLGYQHSGSIGGSASGLIKCAFVAGSNFGVTKNGILYAAGAHISGVINAEAGGTIGGFNIAANQLYTTKTENGVTNGAGICQYGYGPAFWAGGSSTNPSGAPFRVFHDGRLYATKAEISGIIKSIGSGIKGTLTIDDGGIEILYGEYGNGKSGWKADYSSVGINICGSLSVSNASSIYIYDNRISFHYAYHHESGRVEMVQGPYIYHDGAGTAWFKGTWVDKGGQAVTSDGNMKHSIENLDNRYSQFFDLLTPRKFKYNEGTSDRYHSGFITQEIQKALQLSNLSEKEFAGIITYDNGADAEKLGLQTSSALRYHEFVSLNTWQIQLLKPRMTAAEEKIAQLEIEVSTLKEELENLKNR